MKRRLRIFALVLLVLLVLIQLWPAGRTNPPVTSDFDGPPEVESILRRSCYDCHSNETDWRWYGRVAPVSWLLVRDVDKGRRKLNFSKWGETKPAKRSGYAEEIVEEIEEGEMPLENYLRVHPSARVTSAELEVLRRWASESP